MSADSGKLYQFLRSAYAVLHYLHLDHLLMAGVLIAIASNLASRQIDLFGALRARLPAISLAANDSALGQSADAVADTSLDAPLRATLDYVARRYKVSAKALEPVFMAIQSITRERPIDPLLLVAVIGIESRFNPYSQSVVGAQGLMQIIPRFYLDKVPKGSGESPFLDPVINVRVGAEILHETILQRGGLMAGLQQYGGASDDENQTYANKVMAEKRLLEQIARRASANGT